MAVEDNAMLSSGSYRTQDQLWQAGTPVRSRTVLETTPRAVNGPAAALQRRGSPASMRPAIEPAEGEIVRVGGLPAQRLLRLDDVIGNAPALAIGDRLLAGLEAQGDLLLHISGAGPSHQRVDRPRLLRLIIELPLAVPDCIAVLAGFDIRAIMRDAAFQAVQPFRNSRSGNVDLSSWPSRDNLPSRIRLKPRARAG